MVQWKHIADLEKIVTDLIIELYKKYDDDENINICITNQKYKHIHIKRNNKHIKITFKKCMLRSKIIINKSFNLDICCVCYESCNQTLKCGHYLCDSCKSGWFKDHNTCPMCRKKDNYKIGYTFKIPLRIIRISFYNQGIFCWKKNKKRLNPHKYLIKVIKKCRIIKNNNYSYNWNKVHKVNTLIC